MSVNQRGTNTEATARSGPTEGAMPKAKASHCAFYYGDVAIGGIVAQLVFTAPDGEKTSAFIVKTSPDTYDVRADSPDGQLITQGNDVLTLEHSLVDQRTRGWDQMLW